jgi:hypothetical protein
MGAFFDMSEATYHEVKDAFSYSLSKEFRRSPEHALTYQSKEWEVNEDREIFKAVHLLCLEPELQERIVIKDGTWSGALKKEVQELQAKGCIVLKQKGFDKAKAISEKVLNHGLAGLILKNSQAEVSLFWEEDGCFCKARVDVLAFTAHGIVLADLKNFGDLSNEHLIGSQIARMNYIDQMAWYARGIEQIFGQAPFKRVWIFAEDKLPHAVKVRECDDAMMEAGWLSMSQYIPKFKQCQEDNVWPSYPEDEAVAKVPDWAFEVVGGEL